VTLDVDPSQDAPVSQLPPELEGKVDPSTWVGHDGKPARVHLLRRAS
jgi:hypothetical protein